MNLSDVHALRQGGQHEDARRAIVQLAATSPDDALVQYEAACVHDFMGHEAKAVPYYLRAIAMGLPAAELRAAYLGLGSTYRVLGQYADALAAFDQGLALFPDAKDLVVFKAMVEHNMGRSRQAVEALLRVVAETSSDPHVEAYSAAIGFYAQDIERVWP